MKRRTFDILVPLVYVVAILVAVSFRDETVIGAVAAIGAVCVAAYYAAVRTYIKV